MRVEVDSPLIVTQPVLWTVTDIALGAPLLHRPKLPGELPYDPASERLLRNDWLSVRLKRKETC